MGVSCQILVHKSKEGVHRAGQQVTGVVKYAVDQRTEYSDISLSLVGSGRCSWSETDSSDSSKSTTYTGTEQYVKQIISIHAIRNRAINPGCYEYPFSFHLPNDIPPSFKNSTCTIKYQLKIKFVKTAFLSFNTSFSTDITVYGNVTAPVEGPVVFGLEKTLMKLFGENPKVTVKAELEKCALMPGENARVHVNVINNSGVYITAVLAELYSYTTYTANCGRTKKLSEKVKNCGGESPISQKEVSRLCFVVPTLPELYSIQHSRVMSKEYRIRVTLRLPLPHINGQVEVPVAIGERIGYQDPLEMTLTDPGAPPSYWEAMQEDKKKS